LVKVGGVSLPLKGKVLGSGIWEATIKKGTKSYKVTLGMNLGPNDERQITGSVTGDGVDGDFTADLNLWKKTTNEAGPYVGTYNVLLPGAQGNADANFPRGTGVGRVTVSKLGAVKFVGKLE
jgi:hypothetical protein